ncbi:predicted protein [Nematostella vectensis]|uniref:UBX domain-containing protein 11 n=1 Tax=Nematostella vectensis TaxID=45351 RepID=A7T3M1_NEMVE|nr:predicted protein [Nematostella vectensis]|eukprot:XP_001621544.1 hypothetical protein NEMVEDRAFT_v1g221862 [Nematostella vectensis]
MDMTPEKMLSEIPSDFLRRDVLGRLPKASHKGPMTAPSDHELMGSMVSRLAQAENELRNAKKEIIDKDKKIKILQEKVQLLDKARGYSSGTIGDLERKCQALQAQVHEMEEFLADYGMVWVGNSSPTESAYMPLDDDAHPNEDSMVTPTGCGVWNPAASVANPSFEVNFDLVLKNVKELNVLAGEGCAVISRTKDGARLKVPDSIPLALYYNGIVMFEGPFRPFTDPTTQQCMRDIMEGYFPSELQSRYPDGVPINVSLHILSMKFS